MSKMIVGLVAAALAGASAQAAIVDVTIEGTVVFNGVTSGVLAGVRGGHTATMSFQVDSAVFADGTPGDTRGYEIIQPSFSLAFSTPVSVGLLNPFPAGEKAFFTLAEGIPASDGFWVSTSPFSPGGVPIAQTPLQANFDVGYAGATLTSLDILDAAGTYDFDGLTRFSYTLWQSFPDNVRMEIDFSRMTITPAPGPAALLAGCGLLAARRRR